MGGGGGEHMTGQVEHSLIQSRLTGGTTSTRRWSSDAAAAPARSMIRRIERQEKWKILLKCSMAEVSFSCRKEEALQKWELKWRRTTYEILLLHFYSWILCAIGYL